MIEIISQPAAVVSAYDSNLFEFYYLDDLGPFTITDHLTLDNRVIQAGTASGLFAIGDWVKYTISSVVFFVQVIDIDGTDIVLDTPKTLASNPSIEVYRAKQEKQDLKLYMGNIAAGESLDLFATLRAIGRAGTYSIDIAGAVKDKFSTIAPPPPVGVDYELFTNYQLKTESGLLIGGFKTAFYSTTEDLDGTTFPDGIPLRQGDVETFGTNAVLYSRIVGNYVQTLTI